MGAGVLGSIVFSKGVKAGNISNSSILSKAHILLCCYLGGTICFPLSLWGGLWFGTQSLSETNSMR